MKEGLYVHVDDVRDIIDTFGSKGGTGMTIINEEYILSQCKEKSRMYVTSDGGLIRRKE